jgi:hypothetical protein
MKCKKYQMAGGLLVAALAVTAVTGCGNSTATENTTEVESSQNTNTFAYTDGTEGTLVSTTIMARVESIDGNEINISVGGGAGDMSEENGNENGTAPADKGNGTAPDGDSGTAPEMPAEGNGGMATNENGEVTPADGDNSAAPEAAPNGDSSTAPEMPAEGNGGTSANENGEVAPADGDNSAAPNGDNSTVSEAASNGDNSTAPQMPADGADGNTQEMPAEGGDGNTQEMPQMVSATALLTINDESVIVVEDEEGNTAAGTLSDITEGTMLQITFDENGEITEILISANMSGEGSDMDAAADGMSGQTGVVESYAAITEDIDVPETM